MITQVVRRPVTRRLLSGLPWLITILALYYAFRGVDLGVLGAHLSSAEPTWIIGAFLLTCLSYMLRAWRWQALFPKIHMPYASSLKALLLGFFMNNVLPARTGEFVRAHLGARLTGETRTLVLATIASERLIDGLTLSLMFVVFAIGLGNQHLSTNLLYVAMMFAVVSIMVVLTLTQRSRVFHLTDKLSQKFSGRASNYTLTRIQIFIDGLTPLTSRAHLPFLVITSLIIWSVELCVYVCVTRAFESPLALPFCVLFMVTVNFSSLIPAAPGGIGVIEAIASTVLVSIGVEKEHALSMVIAQHLIQYLVVGIPGACVMLSWRKLIKSLKPLENGEGNGS